jgi:hypothetical protein
LPGGSSHRTVLVLFTYGSSGQWVINPTAGRFTTSTYPHPGVDDPWSPVPFRLRQKPPCSPMAIPECSVLGWTVALHPHRHDLLLFALRLRRRAQSSTGQVPSHAAVDSHEHGTSAVPKSICSARIRSLTGTAFAPPTLASRRVGPRFRAAFATTRCSDFCWVIAFRSFVLRATTSVEPSRSPWVRRSDFATIPSPVRAATDGFRATVAGGQLARRARLTSASLSLDTVAHLSLPPDVPSRARRGFRTRQRLGAPRQRPCVFGVEFPPSGPRVWTFTSCQSRHAKRTPRSRRASRPWWSRRFC